MYYNVNARDNRRYVFGEGWPSYRNVSIKQMEDMNGNTADSDKISEDMIYSRDMNEEGNAGSTMRNNGGGITNGMNRDMDSGSNGNMTNGAMQNDTRPMYDTEAGLSNETISGSKRPGTDIPQKDIRLMKELYTALNAILSPIVAEVLNEYEYVGSPIYDDEGVDRETVAQIVGKVLDKAEEIIDEAQEISLEIQEMDIWSRSNLLNSNIEALVLSEIFTVRRPKYRRVSNNYVYDNGRYVGVREQ